MRLLSFDTSTPRLQLCLLEDGRVVQSCEIEPATPNRQEAAAMLVPSIDSLMKQAGWPKDELGAVVVGVGPGSFTGIRTGLVTARTIAHALLLPLVGVSTFECIASQVERPVGIILHCGPASFFAGAFADGPDGQLGTVLAPIYLSAADLVAKLPLMKRWLVDGASLSDLSSYSSGPGATVELTPLPEIKNLAVVAAGIAWNRLSLSLPGARVEADVLRLAEEYHWSRIEPLYLRGPSVTIKR